MEEPLPAGAYDAMVSRSIDRAIAASGLAATLDNIDEAEAADRYAHVVAEVVRRAVAALPSGEHVIRGAGLVNDVIALLDERVARARVGDDRLSDAHKVLTQLSGVSPIGEPVLRGLPRLPLSESALLTNAELEPTLVSELESEIDSADEIEILGAFIRFSGVRQLLDRLRSVVQRGGRVRVLTTTYTGTTEQRALDELRAIGADVRVSYDRTSTRLHAKAWLFKRRSGYTTAYIGSSNLTHQAQVTGLEWNVRASVVTAPEIIEKFEATFNTYWEMPSFVPYEADQFNKELRHARQPSNGDFDLAFVDLSPHPFQQDLLDRVAFDRSQGHNRNLIVAATGTGKTVMAALDYRRLRSELPTGRLLFVAHRKEILKQSQHTFRTALRDGSFGELWVDGLRPENWEAVFASIQSLNVGDITNHPPDYWDMVIVDEFHHAAAPSYQQLLNHVQPKYLLGLTATPERADGINVRAYFDDRIAAELRIWDALEQGLLSPFHYFGISDDTDLSEVKWQAGRYDAEQLTGVYTADDAWVAKVLQAVADKVTDRRKMRALGFCVTVAHANFMAEKFRAVGLNAEAITGTTPRDERAAAIAALAKGTLQAIFAVDVFNEGVDIPAIDTVLFLRPTESSTIFLQQLGRGLRRTEDKEVLTVLDFVGHHRKEFRYDQRFRKLLGGTRTQIEKQVEDDFPFLPAGCDIRLDRMSKEHVLNSIRNSLPTTWPQRQAEAASLGRVSLADYLEATGLELPDIYANKKSYTGLLRAAGLLPGHESEDEQRFGRAIGRMLHTDDMERLTFMQAVLSAPTPPQVSNFDLRQRRLLTMLHYGLWGVQKAKALQDGLAQLWAHDAIRRELVEVAALLTEAVDGFRPEGGMPTENPLRLNAHYSRDEVLAAFDIGSPDKPPQVREGVKWIDDDRTAVLFVTLNKSEKDYSPSTMYKDYALSQELFHWETQSATSTTSAKGQRYLTQRENGYDIALFVRAAKEDTYGKTAAYEFLGLVDYVSHEHDRPISITWKLRNPMTASAFMKYRTAVA